MIVFEDVKKDEEVSALLSAAARQIEVLSFTEHSARHCSIVSNWTKEILTATGSDAREIELGRIAGYLHDVGNSVGRNDHAQTGALIAYNLLMRKGMSPNESCEIMAAIANHDEAFGVPVNRICSALIIADKSDVHKSRVRNKITSSEGANIHDRVNLAAETSFVEVQGEFIKTVIEINNEICSVMDYFEIYHTRMQMCRRAAEFLGYKYTLVINGVKLI